jgi:ubiquinone/menaquinone biosynthesis C-methylase UbiE
MTQLRRTPLLLAVLAGGAVLTGGGFLLGQWTAQPTVASLNTWLGDFDPSVPLFYRPRDKLVSLNPEQIAAARFFIAGIENHDTAQLITAKAAFEKIGPEANPDSEVHPYLWIIEYLLSTPGPAQDALKANKNGRRLIKHFGGEYMPLLPDYLKRKHGLRRRGNRRSLSFLDELVRFLSPTRDAAEHTTKVLDAIGLMPGDTITDVGAGPGYFTWAFAERVGDKGQVHATEINPGHLDFLSRVVRDEGLKNVKVHRTNGSTIDAPAVSLDHVFMSATFQEIYCCVAPEVREVLMSDIHTALRPRGRLTILENNPKPSDSKPSRGTLLAAPLTNLYVTAHGFELIDTFNFSPHRMGLIFEKVDTPE